MSSWKNKKSGRLSCISTNFTSSDLSVLKPNLIQCKKARISFQIGQEQIMQGIQYFYNRSLFDELLYSFLIATTPEVAEIVNEIHHDIIGASTANDGMWDDEPGGDYLDELLGESKDFSYEELSSIVSGLHPKR